MKEILIYRDEGAGSRCLRSLVLELKSIDISEKHFIRFVDRHDLTDENWKNQALILIFPGGRDRLYHQALKGVANENIRDFVQGGGKYLGICAGGYYGCASIEFEKGTPLEIIEKRELAFFPGNAVGPAYGLGQFHYENERGARIALLNFITEDGAIKETAAYFNGGCAFISPDVQKNVRVMADYKDLLDQPAAIVECFFGQGRIVLSGVHPEYSGYHPHIEHAFPKNLLPELKNIEWMRRSLFKEILSRLLSDK